MEWISVKDRLPNRDDECLVARVFDFEPEGRNKDVWHCNYDGQYFWYQTGAIEFQDDGITITHWMPLPQPPKE